VATGELDERGDERTVEGLCERRDVRAGMSEVTHERLREDDQVGALLLLEVPVQRGAVLLGVERGGFLDEGDAKGGHDVKRATCGARLRG
jgi:hypothetical protein